MTGLPFEEISGPQRETTRAAVPVFEVDAAVLDAHHRADVAGLGVLDDHPQLHRVLGRAGLVPTRRQNIGSIAIHHPAILGSLAPKPPYGTPRSGP